MLKRILTSAALLLAITSFAQDGVKDIHPATQKGKTFTMNDIILSSSLRPQSGFLRRHSDELAKKKIWFTDTTDVPYSILAAKDGNLYYKADKNDNDSRYKVVASSADRNISFGKSVSRSEFGIEGGIFASPDGSKIAFYRKDESKVTEFPLLDITTRTGSLVPIKYPMNGMDSEVISLGIYDTTTGTTVYAQVDDFDEDRYLTNISWGPDSKNIFILVLDRAQKEMHLNQYRASDGSFVRTILTEQSSKYVEPLDPLHFVKDTYLFIYRSANINGYRNLYLCDTLGTVRRITEVEADVDYVDYKNISLYYTSAEVSPVENHLFKMNIIPAGGAKASMADKAKIGRPIRLTKTRGWHRPVISLDGKYFYDAMSSFNVPAVYSVVSTDGQGKVVCTETAEDPLKDYHTGEVVFGTLPSADGKYQNWYRLFKPAGFDPAKKYPVVVYVYGGPHSQMVQDKWLGNVRMWELYMAQKGYVVFVMDNRGTSNQGLAYEQAIHKYCGKAEMEDQMVGINMLKGLDWVDSDRIGVHGWSYGGFMTISLMTTYPDVFKVGVAGGPVIDWKWYEIMYGERYMETEKTNPDGFAATSLISKAGNLKGKLLICQGAIDDTCVWEHSLSFVQACIEKGVQVDYFPYPKAKHNVSGKHRVHLYDKITLYFDDYLKP